MLFVRRLLWPYNRLVSTAWETRSLCLKNQSAVAMDVRVDAHTAAELDQCQSTRGNLDLTADADQHSTMQHVTAVGHLADAVPQMAIVALQAISEYDLRDTESVTEIPISCGAGCQSGCGSVGRVAAHPPPSMHTQQTYSNTTTTAPGGNIYRPIPIGAEWFHTSVDTCTTSITSIKTGCECYVRASVVELLYFPPAAAVSNVTAVSPGPAGSLASIMVSNGYTL